jgi:hypothetical protein
MMRVDELIELLQGQDPKAPVVLWGDGDLYDLTLVEKINQEQAATERRHKNTVTLG